ncbi:MAG: biopolymer transporter ExbD [Cyanobacteria bacterium P01_F01_bin.42]
MNLIDDVAEEQSQINIVPMIDVIFAILTFFIVATLFLNKNEGLPVNLPQANSSQVQPATQASLTIQSDGRIFLNREPIELNQLSPELTEIVEAEENLLVILNADEQVQHGLVVQVMDRARRIEGVKLAIATRKK